MPGWRRYGLRVASLILPFGLFVFVAARQPIPGLVLEVHFKNPVILLGIGLFLFLAFRVSGWKGMVCGLSAVLLVFGMELAGVWLSAESDGDLVISGLLPWSDAKAYYTGAQLLAEDGPLSAWHGRRPWFMSLLAVLLQSTQQNLQWSVAILVAITSIACFVLARTLQASLGVIPAVAAVLVLLLFYARFIGTTMSEHLGLSLGAVALALLWQSSQQERLGLSWMFGLWLLACALLARAGAFFVLPALLAWGAWHSYRKLSAQESLENFAFGAGAIGTAFMLDSVLRRVLVPDALPTGNFAYTLYGLVSGNKGWLQARHDHPEILGMGETEAVRYVYELVFAAFRDNPMTAVHGAISAWGDYFSFGGGAFAFISMPVVQWIAIALCGFGLAVCLWRWRDASHSMLLAMTAGVILSVPFVPPIDAQAMRIYAATIPLCALLVALGLYPLAPKSGVIGPTQRGSLIAVAAALAVLLVMIPFLGALALQLSGKPADFQAPNCPPGQASLVVRLTRGSSIRLLEDSAAAQSHVPNVRISDFKAGMAAYKKWYPDLYHALENLRPGQTLRATINLARTRYGEPLWLISDADKTPATGVAQVCARLMDNKTERFYFRQTFLAVPGHGP